MSIGHGRLTLFALLLAACSPSGAPEAEAPAEAGLLPAGAYDLQVPTPDGEVVLGFLLGSDGWAELVNPDGALHVRTRIEWPSAGELVFRDAEGPMACRDEAGAQAGRYRVERDDDGWRFHLVADPCEGRQGALSRGLLVVRTP